MSNIIYNLKCKYCGKEQHGYWSFGHNRQCFDYEWICKECNSKNIERIHAFWMYHDNCKCNAQRSK